MAESPLSVERVPCNTLKLDPKNARKHPDRNIEAIKNSLTRFGQQKPIVVDADGVVVAGNGALQAAMLLGWTHIDIVRTALKGKEAVAFAIADNRTAELAVWDDEVLREIMSGLNEAMATASGFVNNELAKTIGTLHASVGDAELDPNEELTEIAKKWNCSVGHAYALGKHRLICGDSSNEATMNALFENELADLMVTDPPYGVDFSEKNKRLNELDGGERMVKEIASDKSIGSAADILSSVMKNTKKHLAPHASFYVTAPQGCELFPMFLDEIRKSGLNPMHVLIWAKNHHVLGLCDYHYKHEPIIYGWNDKHKWYGDRGETSIIEVDKPSSSKVHPTEKPVPLFSRLIENSSKIGDVVVDPFAGSGTTLIACEQLQRRAFCIEIDPAYCAVIIERWSKLTGKQPLRLPDMETTK